MHGWSVLLLALCRSTLALQPPAGPVPKTRAPAVTAIAPALPGVYANGRALRRALQIPAQNNGAGDTAAAMQAAAMQALVLAGTADSVSQSMHGAVDVGHAAAMALTAATLSGACNALWLRKLEDTWPGTGTYAVVSKSLADYLVCAPLVLSGYLVLVPLLTLLFGGASRCRSNSNPHANPTPHPPPHPPRHRLALALTLTGASLDAVGASLSSASFGWTQEGFQCAMLLNLCTFQPYNLLQFSCVPPSLRPLGGACVSAASTVLLSGITLGYTIEDLVGGGSGSPSVDLSSLDLSLLDLSTSVPGNILERTWQAGKRAA